MTEWRAEQCPDCEDEREREWTLTEDGWAPTRWVTVCSCDAP